MAKSSTKRRPAPEKPVKTRKCVFCSKKGQTIDYKDTALLRTYISERGKIRARRVTGNCVQHQRKIAIEGLGPVELSVKAAGDTGKLFGSVTAADVVTAIKKAGGPNLDKRTVQLPKAHIKSVGTHPIAVRLHPDVDASVSLNVVAG